LFSFIKGKEEILVKLLKEKETLDGKDLFIMNA